jgi:putative ABC transport system permease protein
MARMSDLQTRTLRPWAQIYLYRRRLRAHAVSELLAGVGIAVAVALVLAATVAEGSIAGSTGQVVRAVVGQANLQLRAQDGAGFDGSGFDESLLAKVEAIPGVKQAAPLLEQAATVRAPDGRHVTVDLAGTDVSLAVLDGLAHTLPLDALSPGAIGLSRASADALGISAAAAAAGAGAKASEVTLDLRGRAIPLRVSAVLGPEAAGAVSTALVAVMPLASLQRFAGLPRRVTRILVQSAPGREASVRRGLQALAAGRLTVAPADQDVALLDQALRPSNLASQLFAAIGALLGFLLAFNAMLLTVPERRQAIADLRLAGTRRGAVVQIVLFQALCLGVAASLVGLAAGYALAVWVFHQPTGYLSEAFTLSSGTVVGVGPLLLAGLGGIAATCLASAVPLLDLRRGRARDAVYRDVGDPGNALGGRMRRTLFAAALAVLLAASLVFALAPSLAILAGAMLALATVLAVPLSFAAALSLARWVSARSQSLTSLPVALGSLQATTLRSLALAATGAVALFGSVALGGSRDDLLRGIRSFASSYVADADIWVTNPGDNQAADELAPEGHAAAIARVPGVASVRAFQGGFMQLGDRRVWVIARPPGGSSEVLRTQVVSGTPARADARLAQGGWVAVSAQIAAEHHTRVGGSLTLQTPTGAHRFRIAATTTNLAWPPGVIFMGTSDYSRYWRSTAPTAFAVNLMPGVSAATARAAIQSALGPGSGLEVSLASTRAARIDALAGEGLGQLGEIATLLLLAAILAMAAALGSSIWQRRRTLADLRLLGVRPSRLRRILLLEATLMLGAGCVTGAAAGVYGQLVLDGYLKRVTGFPLARMATGARPLEIFAFVLALALALAAAPGWLASRVPPAFALEES